MIALAIVSFTLAGKIEEKEQPGFENSTYFMNQNEKPSHDQLMDLQENLLVTFGFDLNFPNALSFIDWYLNVICNTIDLKIQSSKVR